MMQVLLTLGIPESPFWLIKKKRSSQAKRVLLRIRPDGWPVVREMVQINQNLRSVATMFHTSGIDGNANDNSSLSYSNKYNTVIHSLKLLFFKHKKQTFLSLFFMFAQQVFSSIFSFLLFSFKTFSSFFFSLLESMSCYHIAALYLVLQGLRRQTHSPSRRSE